PPPPAPDQSRGPGEACLKAFHDALLFEVIKRRLERRPAGRLKMLSLLLSCRAEFITACRLGRILALRGWNQKHRGHDQRQHRDYLRRRNGKEPAKLLYAASYQRNAGISQQNSHEFSELKI